MQTSYAGLDTSATVGPIAERVFGYRNRRCRRRVVNHSRQSHREIQRQSLYQEVEGILTNRRLGRERFERIGPDSHHRMVQYASAKGGRNSANN